MSRPPSRPKLFAFETGHRRPRQLPSFSPVRAVLIALATAAVVAAAFLTWRVWPLLDTSAGAIPQSPGGAKQQAGGTGGGGPPALWDTGASTAPIPGVHASGAIVIDAATGRVLWELHPHRQLPVASLTKLMTTLVALEPRRLDRSFAVTPAMTSVPGYTIGLRSGQTVTERQMLAAALIASANDAANALAVHRAGSIEKFVTLMNRTAHDMGLRDTRYSNPSGIYDTGNHSSAWDIADLTRHVLQQPTLRRLVRLKAYAAPGAATYVNRNQLLWSYQGAIGVKTGSTTAAGNCLAVAARRHGTTMIAVLLHAGDNQFEEAAHLLTWGFGHDSS